MSGQPAFAALGEFPRMTDLSIRSLSKARAKALLYIMDMLAAGGENVPSHVVITDASLNGEIDRSGTASMVIFPDHVTCIATAYHGEHRIPVLEGMAIASGLKIIPADQTDSGIIQVVTDCNNAINEQRDEKKFGEHVECVRPGLDTKSSHRKSQFEETHTLHDLMDTLSKYTRMNCERLPVPDAKKMQVWHQEATWSKEEIRKKSYGLAESKRPQWGKGEK